MKSGQLGRNFRSSAPSSHEERRYEGLPRAALVKPEPQRHFQKSYGLFADLVHMLVGYLGTLERCSQTPWDRTIE